MGSVFSVPTFFVLFRETTEAALIISVLLTFCKQMFGDDPLMLKRLNKQIWMGTGLGLLVSIAIAAGIIGAWYAISENVWESRELVWEGTLAIIACVIITIVGITMLKSSRKGHQEKWRKKLLKEMARHNQAPQDTDSEGLSTNATSQATLQPTTTPTPTTRGSTHWFARIAPKAYEKLTSEKYALFLIPFITILREGIEAIIFMGGVGLTEPGKSIPLPAITGILVGALVGFVTYRTGSRASLQWFFIISTCLLFLIAAGLLARGILSFETNAWMKKVLYNTGGGDEGGPIPVDLRDNVWFLDCCGAKENGWSIFNAIAGWSNIATKGSIIGYCMYWVVVSGWLIGVKTREQKLAKRGDVDEIKVGTASQKGSRVDIE
ncbi:hypothetical protein SpCBS45565_g07569 [Spizellomyces sp. 'palustris']|nr:hypothetical protein SpCBS45565_g07569 [Spizellomyces sp. 'palustris']